MEPTKADVIKQGSVAHQQALVQALTKRTVKTVKRIIPGGVNMLNELDQSILEVAVYNWLRGTRHFTQVTLSLAKDPAKFRIREQKLIDFDENQQYAAWVTHPKGKRYLAEIMAEALKKHRLVYLTAKKDGLWMGVDTQRVFGPTRKATKADVELATDALAGEEAPFGVGDQIYNEDWEPFIEFIPQRKKQYGY